jgi:anti-sigma regulatory factor (Ser/Thr protein kinase)
MVLLRLPFAPEADGAAIRHAAGALLSDWQTPELVEDTLLVIAELVHNVLQHTDAGGELVLIHGDGEIVVEVSDRSPRLPRPYPPDHRRVGGRGLLLVGALARRWGSRRTRAARSSGRSCPVPPRSPRPLPDDCGRPASTAVRRRAGHTG